MDPINKLPVTVITGFLGAGKTTFLNNLLASSPEKRFVVIENEFGNESIDGMLVSKEVDPKLFDLANGCICCNLNDDLIEVLKSLLDPSHSYTNLLIETTGIADPAGVIKPFLSDPVISQGFVLDAVICLADARILEDLFSETKEAIQQISLADVVVLNKADTVSIEYIDLVKATIQKVNPFAEIEVSEYGRTSRSLIDLQAYSSRKTGMFTVNYSAFDQKEHLFETESIAMNGLVDLMQFKAWVHSYCFFNQRTVFRMKGVFCATDGNIYTLQTVKDSVSIELYPDKFDMKDGRIIVIGRSLKIDAIRESIESLLLD